MIIDTCFHLRFLRFGFSKYWFKGCVCQDQSQNYSQHQNLSEGGNENLTGLALGLVRFELRTSGNPV